MYAYTCPNCKEEDKIQVTCPICDTHYCEVCEKEENVNFKPCHICDKKVCVKCYTEHKVNGVRTCDDCFDDLIVIKSNYDVITKAISEVLLDGTKAMDSDYDYSAFGLGMVCGQLQGLKNRFGF